MIYDLRCMIWEGTAPITPLLFHNPTNDTRSVLQRVPLAPIPPPTTAPAP